MKAEVISLADHRPHLSGEVKCLHCGHRWVGIVQVGSDALTSGLQCEECGLFKGFYVYPVLPGEGDEIYFCGCGGDLFTIGRAGSRCIRCGTIHNPMEAEG